MHLDDLLLMLPEQRYAYACQLGAKIHDKMADRHITFAIMGKLRTDKKNIIAEGQLDVAPKGFGYLRLASANYLPGPYDVYVSASQVEKFKLYSGCIIAGEVRRPKEKENWPALLKVLSINGIDAADVLENENIPSLKSGSESTAIFWPDV